MVISAAALAVAVLGGLALFSKTKDQEAELKQTVAKLDQQGELIEMLLAEQARLRERGGADDIVAQAERNVAKQENLSPEEVRLAVNSAIAKAEAEVAGAKGAAKADALKRLADAQMAAGLRNEATANYQKRLELLSRSEQPEEWADSIATVAGLLFSREYADDGPKMVREALAWAEASDTLGPEHPATLRLKDMLRQFVFIKGDYETAIAMGKEIQEIWDRTKGADATESIKAAAYLGRHLRTDGQYEEAEVIFKRIIASHEERYGEDDIRTLDARWDLANSLMKQERFSEAEVIYTDILARAKKSLGAGDSQVLALGAALAFLKEAEGKDAEGLLIWKGLLEDAAKFNEEDSEEVQVYMDVVVIRELENENFETAGEMYRKLYESRVRTLGEFQLKTVNTLDRLALVYRKAGDQERYMETMPKVIAGKIEALGPDSLDIAQDQYDLAVTLSNEDKPQEAFEVISEAIALRKRVLGATDPRTLSTLVMGQIIANQTKDWNLATKAGEEALAAFEERGDEFAESRASVLFRLALAYEMLEENEVALEYARSSARIAVDSLEAGHELHGLLTKMIRRLK